MSPLAQPISGEFKIGEFLFNADTLELFNNGERIAFAVKPAQLLCGLIAASPQILTRDEAQELLWDDAGYVDPEHGLNACVRQLRAALGDNATSPKFVETLPKRGYRLLATPVCANHEGPAANENSLPSFVAGLMTRRAAIVLAPIVLILGWVFLGSGLRSASDSAIPIETAILKAEALRLRGQTSDLEQALTAYEGVLIDNPNAARALAGKSAVLAQLAGRSGYPSLETFQSALEFASAAERIEPLSDAALARGFATLYGQFEPSLAIGEFDEAVRRDTRNAAAHSGRAAALGAAGRLEEAVSAATAATVENPLSYSARSDLCWYLLFDDRHPEARDACTLAIEIDADHTFSFLGAALASAEKGETAMEYFGRYFENRNLTIEDGEITPDGISCSLAARAKTRAEGGEFSPYEAAALFGLCGDGAGTKRLLEAAAAERQSALLFLEFDPRFDRVRDQLPSKEALFGY